VLLVPFCGLIICFLASSAQAKDVRNVRIEDYEGRQISAVELVFEGTASEPNAQAEFFALLKVAPNTQFSAVHVRESLQALFDSGRVANARVEVVEEGTPKTGPVRLRFVVQRQVQIGDVKIELTGPATGTPISTDELRARMNFVQSNNRLTNQIVLRNADEIQIYLREHGYFNATVEPVQQVGPRGLRANVTYRITPGEQAKVEAFDIQIDGFNAAPVKQTLTLQPSVAFTRDALTDDVKKVRDALINQGFLSPALDDPRVERDAETNMMRILLKGVVGPKVSVVIKNYEISEKTQRDLLPVKREGNVDFSAIVEGARRIRNKLQEDGYFFADVTQTCTVSDPPADLGPNGTEETCENLNPIPLTGHNITIAYDVEQGRRFHLSDIRITGTNHLTYADVEASLKTQKSNPIGLIPWLGYGRGYTSLTLLEQDRRTVEAFMRDLGFRRATVTVLQGVSINGDSLIITFNVNEGPLTRIAGLEIKGNKIYTDDKIRQQLRTVVIGAPYSRSLARADADRVATLYSREGYVDTRVDFSVVELPPKNNEEQVRLVYAINAEGDKVFINTIIINGVTGDTNTKRTKRAAIRRAIPIAPGDVLRADRISDAERELYLTDAYRQVVIHTEPAGETTTGYKQRDVVIDVEEKQPNVMDYGGGFSTDAGALGLFEISNVNLQNKLRQGAMRLRASRRQQLVRLEYLDPRFARYNKTQFAPLAASVEYQRDSTITRFFRSAIDRGTMGIVQRLDEKGNPIDIFGAEVHEPTINRFTAAVETQRVLDRRTRTIVFGRLSYEDVRLFNLESLVVRPILEPDRKVRLARLGASLVRDTRQRCEKGLLARSFDEDEVPGKPGEVCRYNQLDATRGEFLSVDYAVALRQLGGNISFNRFQATYRRYYKVSALRDTVFAGNMTLGLANLFNPRDRDGNGTIDEIDLTLPISERFFSGGSTTLRGFGFEEAGPRQVVIPEGEFRDSKKNLVFLNPFTVPVGGNALAVLNLEARIPMTKSVQVVPFYDGGNVFRRISDLFGKEDTTPVPAGDILAAINKANLRAHWSNTVGLGFRLQTPFGGALAIDYGVLLKPPEFLIPQRAPNGIDFTDTPAIFRLRHGNLHFRITQTF
jgi:outer membrane protein insertion porin family